MAPRLEFSLLGPLLVCNDGAVVPVSVGRQRALLVALLLNSGRTMTSDELIDVLWGSSPPASAQATLYNYVKRLRKALGDSEHSRILTQPHGYAIKLNPGEVDVHRFETRLQTARAALRTGAWDDASVQARAGLSLWRGEPLADAGSETLARQEVPRLTEMRLQAMEVRLEADLHLGRHAEVIPELRQLIGAHPLREQWHALLMTALYKSDRQAEALDVYRDLHRMLTDELGTEPSARVRELHRWILNGDWCSDSAQPDSAYSPARNEAPRGPARPVPRSLPGGVPEFVGREDELAALTRLLAQAGRAPGTVVISAIGGTAGVGKTAMAVHWAHRVADRFPDGQLYVNLRGYDTGPPVSSDEALAGFLRALGVPGREIPSEVGERAASYRSLLAGRRVLVLLDNAASSEQVRPLLPGAEGCMALVTSRDSLVGLVAREGACRLELDLMPMSDAIHLLQVLIGERALADPDATRILAGQCSRLPLALRVAAERATARGDASLASLTAELADERRRLDLLDADGDLDTAVRSVFSWSYRHLDAATSRAFRLASLSPGPEVDAYAMAALMNATTERAGNVLGFLARANLVQPRRPGHYIMHDLLRDYARELSAAEDDAEAHTAALTRLFDFYLGAAAAAMDIVFVAEYAHRPGVPGAAVPVPALTSQADALAWLDSKLSDFVAVTAYSAAHGWPSHAIRLAGTLYRYLDGGGHFAEAAAIHGNARGAARSIADRAAEAEALTNLGVAGARQGRYQKAGDHLERALSLYRAVGDQAGEARALSNLGYVHIQRSHYERAEEDLHTALGLHRAVGDQAGEAHALCNLASIDVRQGRYEQAADRCRLARSVYRRNGNRVGEAHAMCNLGEVEMRQGNYRSAASHYRRSLALFRAAGERSGEADALINLADADYRQGRYQRALDQSRRSLAVFREIGEVSGQVHALHGVGQALLAAGRSAEACAQYTDALALARRTSSLYEQARAQDGLGRAWQALGQQDQARTHWQQALALYSRLGAPEADEVRALLREGSGSVSALGLSPPAGGG
jgi:DNA-binding SARP family transcriptional activator/tetratricopeptide (TPR) repeat protein